MSIEEVMKFSTNLKKYLEENKLTLKELSEKIGVPASTAHSWINGVPPKNIKIMKEIARILNITVDELCFGETIKEHDTNLVITIGSESFKLILKKIKTK
jgi:transcriptional regulator with XRE-family HTH domain